MTKNFSTIEMDSDFIQDISIVVEEDGILKIDQLFSGEICIPVSKIHSLILALSRIDENIRH